MSKHEKEKIDEFLTELDSELTEEELAVLAKEWPIDRYDDDDEEDREAWDDDDDDF